MATITINHLYRNGDPTVGKVGDGATILHYSDSEPATIIARTAKTITVQVDSHEITGGTFPDFEYAYKPNPNGAIKKFRFSAKRGWQQGRGGNRLLIGSRRYYHDPTF